MAGVALKSLTKSFGPTTAVSNLSLEIADGELVTLLGPSGCGKTTTLRMIAGFIEPDSGTVSIGDSVVSDPGRGIFLAPQERELGMVFQSYAVWPHMNVFDNIAYPLKVRKTTPSEIRRRVRQVAEQVKMPDLLLRFPSQLSGGQQQRVALARALVAEPRVLLLDEPLSNLDAKLREQMRLEIKELQRRIGVTIVFVTHDQEEAMSLSDSIAVIDEGRLLQAGSPREIYEHPADEFVARFIGAANLLPLDPTGRHVNEDPAFLLPVSGFRGGGPGSGATAVVRPEDVSIATAPKDGYIEAQVQTSLYLGDEVVCFLKRGERRLTVKLRHEVTPQRDESLYFRVEHAAVVPGTRH